jgi:hypothetical protein
VEIDIIIMVSGGLIFIFFAFILCLETSNPLLREGNM